MKEGIGVVVVVVGAAVVVVVVVGAAVVVVVVVGTGISSPKISKIPAKGDDAHELPAHVVITGNRTFHRQPENSAMEKTAMAGSASDGNETESDRGGNLRRRVGTIVEV